MVSSDQLRYVASYNCYTFLAIKSVGAPPRGSGIIMVIVRLAYEETGRCKAASFVAAKRARASL